MAWLGLNRPVPVTVTAWPGAPDAGSTAVRTGAPSGGGWVDGDDTAVVELVVGAVVGGLVGLAGLVGPVEPGGADGAGAAPGAVFGAEFAIGAGLAVGVVARSEVVAWTGAVPVDGGVCVVGFDRPAARLGDAARVDSVAGGT